MSDADNCAICKRPEDEGQKRYQPDGKGGLLANCRQCGRYGLIGEAAIAASYSWPAEIRGPLSCATRQVSEFGQTLRITAYNAAELAEQHANARASENIDKLLAETARQSGRPGGWAKFDPDTDFTLIDCYSRTEFDQYIAWISDAGLVSKRLVMSGQGPVGDPIYERAFQMSLTMDGWSRGQPLPRPGGLPGRCFRRHVIRPVHGWCIPRRHKTGH